MERIISQEDRIRRAEQIANRRREKISARSINISTGKKKMSLLSKVFIQTITSICIFGIAYLGMKNNTQILQNIKFALENDIDFKVLYDKGNETINYIMSQINNKSEEEALQENKTEEDNIIDGNETEEDNTVSENEIQENSNEENNQIGMGGANDNSNLSQDEQDIAYIKANVSLIVPVQGTITSGYGKREATEIVSENHGGLDIGANEGTEIIASMEGNVELVSTYGDYGNHIKITNGEVSTLYAHCSKILVKEGDYISQGQKIAEVGNTGRTTGPHLHFEVSRDNRRVNPQSVLNI